MGADNATFFYTILDDALRPYKVFRHALGVKEDPLIYHEPDERFTVDLASTRSRAYIFINIDSSLTSEVRYLRKDQPSGEFRVLLPRVQETEYDVTHHGDSFFIRTNDGAKGFRVVEAPVAIPRRPTGRKSSPAATASPSKASPRFQDYLVIEERHRGLTQICIRDFAHRRAALHSNFPSRSTPPSWAPTPSSTPNCCASTTRRWSRRLRSSTTTWKPASAS